LPRSALQRFNVRCDICEGDGQANDLRGALLWARLWLRHALLQQACMDEPTRGVGDPRPKCARVGAQVGEQPRGTRRQALRFVGVGDKLDGGSRSTAHAWGQHGRDGVEQGGAVVASDPLCELQVRDIEYRFGVDEPQYWLHVVEFEFLCQRNDDAVERALSEGHAYQVADREIQTWGALIRESVARDVGPRVDDYFYVRGFFVRRDQAASPPARSIGPGWLAGGSNSTWGCVFELTLSGSGYKKRNRPFGRSLEKP
jgi:hypothetical protein